MSKNVCHFSRIAEMQICHSSENLNFPSIALTEVANKNLFFRTKSDVQYLYEIFGIFLDSSAQESPMWLEVNIRFVEIKRIECSVRRDESRRCHLKVEKNAFSNLTIPNFQNGYLIRLVWTRICCLRVKKQTLMRHNSEKLKNAHSGLKNSILRSFLV